MIRHQFSNMLWPASSEVTCKFLCSVVNILEGLTLSPFLPECTLLPITVLTLNGSDLTVWVIARAVPSVTVWIKGALLVVRET